MSPLFLSQFDRALHLTLSFYEGRQPTRVRIRINHFSAISAMRDLSMLNMIIRLSHHQTCLTSTYAHTHGIVSQAAGAISHRGCR
jgi:hypothetical protein